MASSARATAHIQRQGVGGSVPDRLAGAIARRPAPCARIALGVLLAGTAAFLFHVTRGTTFWVDEWNWILGRRTDSVGTFLDPHNGHLSVIPVLIYRALFATVGLTDYAPYRALVIAGHLGCVVLVFAYASRRVGPFAALAAATLILFLGPAWQNVLWPFQIAWLISVGAGIGALLMLDRRTRRTDIAASALLGVSIASTGLGVAIALGVVVEVLWARRRWRDAWIFAIPLAGYGAWWVGYGESNWIDVAHATGIAHPVLNGVLGAPQYAAGSAAATLSALAGLSGQSPLDPGGDGTAMTFGPALALLALAALVWRVRVLGAVPPRAAALLVTAASFWAFTAVTRGFISPPTTSRYLYVGAVFLVLAAVELARGSRLGGWPLAVVAVALAAIAVSNVGAYRNAAAYLRNQAQLTRADVGAVDIARPLVAPGFRLNGILSASAGPLLASEAAWGSPAATPAEIAAAPENARRLADLELIRIHAAALRAAPAPAPRGSAPRVARAAGVTAVPRGSCVVVRPAPVASRPGAHRVILVLGRAGAAISAQGGPVGVGLRRFADESQALGQVSAGASATLAPGADGAPQPWLVDLSPVAGATVCSQG